ncbi:ubiquitin-like-conjugating enzyme ATG10-like, partial [Scleropages formosus]
QQQPAARASSQEALGRPKSPSREREGPLEKLLPLRDGKTFRAEGGLKPPAPNHIRSSRVSLRCCDPGSSPGSADGYMKKTVLGRGKINTPSLDGSCKSEEDVCALGKETQEGAQDGSEWEALDAEWSAAIRYEYHVLYSSSYQTPVLYFRASALDGRPLSLEEMWDNVHPSYRRRLLHSPWDTITQQLNYIVSWLSVVGPMVGLEIPLSYATVASKPERTAAR